MPFTATWMDVAIIILSEVSQTEKSNIIYHLHVKSRKRLYNQTSLQNRKRPRDIENKLIVTKRESGGRGGIGVWN